MNFFGSNANQGPSALTVAKVEAEVLTDMFNRKCVVRNTDQDLSVGEMSCVDRCVGKYMQAQENVGKVLQNVEQQMKAQEAANAQLNAQFRGGRP